MKKETETQPDLEGPEDDKPMSFWDHLEELRRRLVRALIALVAGTLIAWNFRVEIFMEISRPFAESLIAQHVTNVPSVHTAAPGDTLIAFVKLSLMAGTCLAAPMIFYQLWAFVAPGLYAKEKRYVIPFVVASTLLFIAGGYFAFIAVLPMTFDYFNSLAGDIGGVITITPTVMMDEYISFVVQLFLGFGAIFEIPIIFTFLARTGLITHRKLIRWARYYVFIAFLLAAILTPPDAASQLAMAIPACLLYGVSIGLVYIFQRKDALLADIEAENEAKRMKADEGKPSLG